MTWCCFRSLNYRWYYIFHATLLLTCASPQSLYSDEEIREKSPSAIIRVEDYGAIPNDGKDDSKAIQKAIEACLNSKEINIVSLGAGTFDLDHGISTVKFKPNKRELDFVTVHITGHSPVYDQNIGASTVLNVRHKGYGIAIQKCRNSTIENICFKGQYRGAKDLSSILSENKIDRGGKNNPSCAIVIDPFDSRVERKNRYSGSEKYYVSASNEGSSMLTVDGCAFIDHYVAIANNTSAVVNNGDNIVLRNSHVKRCHVLWACGQSQSRANLIENVYSLFIHTFVDGRNYGAGNGTPPVIENCNIAGFTKYLFNVRTGFSGVAVYRSYIEGLWSAGLVIANFVSFDQSQVKFHIPKANEQAPPFHLYTNRVASFRDCSLEYFSNCTHKSPLLLKSSALNVSGGNIQGGVLTSNGYTNRGGERIHNVSYDQVFIDCLGKVAGKAEYSKPIVNLSGEIVLGGSKLATNKGDIFENTGDTYNVFYTESKSVHYTDKSLAYFTSSTPGLYAVGDNIFSSANLDLGNFGLSDHRFRSFLGVVHEIKGKKVILKSVPKISSEKPVELYVVEYPVFNLPVWASFQKGNDVAIIREEIPTRNFPTVGQKFYLPIFNGVVSVVDVNMNRRTVTFSQQANTSVNDYMVSNNSIEHSIEVKSEQELTNRMVLDGATVRLKYEHGKERIIEKGRIKYSPLTSKQ